MSTGQLQPNDSAYRELLADIDELNRRVFQLETMLAPAPARRQESLRRFVEAVHRRLARADFADAEEAREFLRASTGALEREQPAKYRP